jgi:hypothetical protein
MMHENLACCPGRACIAIAIQFFCKAAVAVGQPFVQLQPYCCAAQMSAMTQPEHDCNQCCKLFSPSLSLSQIYLVAHSKKTLEKLLPGYATGSSAEDCATLLHYLNSMASVLFV